MGHAIDTGLTFAIDAPERLGQDRIADAAAAAAGYPLPCMTVDLGTATTYNVIDAQRRSLGGFIVPGVLTSLRAISARTAQLPPIAPEAPARLIGKNTVECLNGGAVFGTAAMLEGLADRVEAELGAPLTVVATGTCSMTPTCCSRGWLCCMRGMRGSGRNKFRYILGGGCSASAPHVLWYCCFWLFTPPPPAAGSGRGRYRGCSRPGSNTESSGCARSPRGWRRSNRGVR